MGKLEKAVVLTVLFLVALILGVSLNAPEAVAKPDPTVTADRGTTPESEKALDAKARTKRSAPITRRETQPGGAQEGGEGERLMLAQGDATSRAAAAPLAPGAGPAGTLSTGRPEPTVADRAQPGITIPVSIPTPSAAAPAASAASQKASGGSLETQVGLAPSLSEEFMIYTWQAGDTFAGVAERYFGSRLHVNRLLRNNEGLEDRELEAGDQILIPVHAAEESAAKAAGGTGGASGATTYTVQSGDVLGTISMTVYGTSKSWRKIYDANRDVLADPNRLVVGQVLRIPE